MNVAMPSGAGALSAPVRKMFSCLMAVVLVVGLVPLPAYAAPAPGSDDGSLRAGSPEASDTAVAADAGGLTFETLSLSGSVGEPGAFGAETGVVSKALELIDEQFDANAEALAAIAEAPAAVYPRVYKEKDFSSKRLVVALSEGDVAPIDKRHVVSEGDGLYLLKYSTEQDAAKAYVRYTDGRYSNVVFAAPDEAVQVADAATQPVDVSEITADFSTVESGASKLRAEGRTDSASQVIALIDTGAPESKNVVSRTTVLGYDELGDDNGHGGNMLSEILDQNSGAKVISIKALDNTGVGTAGTTVAAIRQAVSAGATIINLSFAGYATKANEAIAGAVNEAVDAGVTVIAAAGNDGRDARHYTPANVDNAYVVGACDDAGNLLENTNFGRTVDAYVASNSTSNAAAKTAGWLSLNIAEGWETTVQSTHLSETAPVEVTGGGTDDVAPEYDDADDTVRTTADTIRVYLWDGGSDDTPIYENTAVPLGLFELPEISTLPTNHSSTGEFCYWAGDEETVDGILEDGGDVDLSDPDELEENGLVISGGELHMFAIWRQDVTLHPSLDSESDDTEYANRYYNFRKDDNNVPWSGMLYDRYGIGSSGVPVYGDGSTWTFEGWSHSNHDVPTGLYNDAPASDEPATSRFNLYLPENKNLALWYNTLEDDSENFEYWAVYKHYVALQSGLRGVASGAGAEKNERWWAFANHINFTDETGLSLCPIDSSYGSTPSAVTDINVGGSSMWTFKGWRTNANGDAKWGSATPVTDFATPMDMLKSRTAHGNKSLYAIYTRDLTLNFAWETSDVIGDPPTSYVATQNYISSDPAATSNGSVVYTSFKTPDASVSRDGYTFKDWKINGTEVPTGSWNLAYFGNDWGYSMPVIAATSSPTLEMTAYGVWESDDVLEGNFTVYYHLFNKTDDDWEAGVFDSPTTTHGVGTALTLIEMLDLKEPDFGDREVPPDFQLADENEITSRYFKGWTYDPSKVDNLTGLVAGGQSLVSMLRDHANSDNVLHLYGVFAKDAQMSWSDISGGSLVPVEYEDVPQIYNTGTHLLTVPSSVTTGLGKLGTYTDLGWQAQGWSAANVFRDAATRTRITPGLTADVTEITHEIETLQNTVLVGYFNAFYQRNLTVEFDLSTADSPASIPSISGLTQTYLTGATVPSVLDVTIPATEPVKAGKEFLGWKQKDNDEDVDDAGNQVLYDASGDEQEMHRPVDKSNTITLVPVWDPPDEGFTVTYKSVQSNGSTEDTLLEASSLDGDSTAAAFSALTGAATLPTGWTASATTLAGWSKTKNGTTVDVAVGATMDSAGISSDTTLYAVWERPATFTYKTSTGGNGSDTSIKQRLDGNATAVSAPTDASATFTTGSSGTWSAVGWNETDATTSPTAVTWSSTLAGGPALGGTGTTAIFDAVYSREVSVDYNQNAPSGATGTVSGTIPSTTATQYYNAAATGPDQVTLTLSGTYYSGLSNYTNDGWVETAAGTSLVTSKTATPALNAAPTVEVFAHWTASTPAGFTVTYKSVQSNGTTEDTLLEASAQSATSTAAAFGALTGSATLPTGWTPSATTLAGWSKSKNSTTVDVAVGATMTSAGISDDTTLYAVWSREATFTWREAGGGSASDSTAKQVLAGNTSTLAQPAAAVTGFSALPGVTAAGWTATGWAAADTAANANAATDVTTGLTTASISVTNPEVGPFFNVIYTRTLSFTLDKNGANESGPFAASPTTAAQKLNAGATSITTTPTTVTMPSDTLTQTGKDFIGWSDDASNAEELNATAAGGSYTIEAGPTDDAAVKLYANWKDKDGFTVTYVSVRENGSTEDTLLTATFQTSTDTAASFTSLTDGTATLPTGWAASAATLAGWSKTKNGTTVDVAVGTTMDAAGITANTTLYAVWTRDATFTYKKADGSDPTATEKAAKQSLAGNATKVDVPSAAAATFPTGATSQWEAKGWHEDTANTVPGTYAWGTSITGGPAVGGTSTTATFNAVYQRSVKIDYDKNKPAAAVSEPTGSITTDTTADQMYNAAGSVSGITASLSSGSYNLTGYTQTGWKKTSAASDTTAITTLTVAASDAPAVNVTDPSVKVYAMWEEALANVRQVTLTPNWPSTGDSTTRNTPTATLYLNTDNGEFYKSNAGAGSANASDLADGPLTVPAGKATVTWDANGGSWSGATTQTTQTDLVFNGYFANTSGGTALVSSTGVLPSASDLAAAFPGTGAITLQGQWGTPSAADVPASDPTRTGGYVLDGWSETGAAGSGAAATSLDRTKTVTYKAVWKGEEITVEYITNGTAFATSKVSVDSSDLKTIAQLAADASSGLANALAARPSLTGWNGASDAVTLLGYTTDATAGTYTPTYMTSNETAAKSVASLISSGTYDADHPIKLYAIWARDVKLHSGSTPTVTTLTGTNGQLYNNGSTKLSVSGSALVPITGWTPKGWALTDSATAAEADLPAAGNTNYTGAGASDLYAVYERDLSVAYDKNTGAVVSGMPATKTLSTKQTHNAGKDISTETVTVTYADVAPATAPTRTDGYVNVGWGENTTDTTSFTSFTMGETLAATSATKTVYAIWSDNAKTVTVHRYLKDLSPATTYTAAGSVELSKAGGSTITSAELLAEGQLAVNGFTPSGMYTAVVPESSGRTLPATPLVSITVADDDSTAVDVYYTRNTYEIEFAGNPGTDWDWNAADIPTGYSSGSMTVEFDASATIKNPVKSGFDFDGWTITSVDTTVPSKTAYDGTTALTQVIGVAGSTATTHVMGDTFQNLRLGADTTKVTFTPTWKGKQYTVKYFVDDATTPAYSQAVTLVAGTPAYPLPMSNANLVGHLPTGWTAANFVGWAEVATEYAETSAAEDALVKVTTDLTDKLIASESNVGDDEKVVKLYGVLHRDTTFQWRTVSGTTLNPVTKDTTAKQYANSGTFKLTVPSAATAGIAALNTNGWSATGWAEAATEVAALAKTEADAALVPSVTSVTTNVGPVFNAIYTRALSVTLDKNGADSDPVNPVVPTSVTQTYNAGAGVPFATTDPASVVLPSDELTQTGYKFIGWSNDATNTDVTRVTAAGGTYTLVGTDYAVTDPATATLYANWATAVTPPTELDLADLTYNGREQSVITPPADAGWEIVDNSDKGTNAGSYTLKVKPTAGNVWADGVVVNANGEAEIPWKIKPFVILPGHIGPIADEVVRTPAEQIKPPFTVEVALDPTTPEVKTDLAEGIDYTVTYGPNAEVGIGTVTVFGQGNFTTNPTDAATDPGATKNFNIVEAPADYIDLDKATIELSQYEYAYDGTAKTPTVVTVRGESNNGVAYTFTTADAGTLFTVDYANNTAPGTARANIHAVAGAVWSASSIPVLGNNFKNFYIDEAAPPWGTPDDPFDLGGASVGVTPPSVVYDGEGHIPERVEVTVTEPDGTKRVVPPYTTVDGKTEPSYTWKLVDPRTHTVIYESDKAPATGEWPKAVNPGRYLVVVDGDPDVYYSGETTGVFDILPADGTLTVSFSPNTGDDEFGGEMEENPVHVSPGETIILPENPFTYEGHHFTGWNTASDGSGDGYQPGDVFPAGEGGIVEMSLLYAQWEEDEPSDDTVTITYVANGGKGKMSATKGKAGTKVALREVAFKRGGYAFAGWNTEADGSGDSYTNKQKITLSEDMTLYAQWAAVTVIPMYRLCNPENDEHLYTADTHESWTLTSQRGWVYEGVAWYAPKSKSGDPVYRLCNKKTGEHHYTTDKKERNKLKNSGEWAYEGIAWYSYDGDAKQTLYRLYNPSLTVGAHHYTKDANEVSVLTSERGWTREGVGWYGVPC